MQDLIKVSHNAKNEPVVSARDLHQFLEAKERFGNWMERNMQYGFTENLDYVGCKLFNTLANQELQDYVLSFDMAKEVSMIQRSEQGKKARQYFIECEKKLKSLAIPATYGAALLEAGRLAIELEAQTAKLIQAESTITEQAPKIAFYEAITESSDTIDMATAAKVLNLGIGRNTLYAFLRKVKILQANNQPYQRFCESQYFKVVETTWEDKRGNVHIEPKTVVFQKGLEYIRKIYNSNKNLLNPCPALLSSSTIN